ncbi:uncharacterized protein LOC120151226 [Hibiscus syriacus]|uniref:uncharacterized protein LOC120151226 n=1 Tax=Hibiscus syriacus TaxID=106335 RepID=UPI0019230240|nr:uncharacterized protein LOC120151226 [Hibiscus syriacus]
MDQEERDDRIETSQNSSQIDVNSKNSNNEILSETVTVKNSEENVDLGLQIDGSGLCKHQEMGYVRGIGPDSSKNDQRTRKSSSLVERNVNNGVVSSEGFVEASEVITKMRRVDEVDRRSGNSDDSADGCAVETIIMVNTQEAAYVSESNGVLQLNDIGTDSGKVLAERLMRKEDSCVLDINGSVGGQRRFKESSDGERICRICHLTSEQSYECTDSMPNTAAATDLIQLGCGCKDELGIAHSHCAEAWFKLKGNRMCEICGQTAKNITGVRDNRDWHDQGSTSIGFSPSDQGARCWRGQPFCNFLMACLVIAFVLPWFFHVNTF